jgi:hypothetical protein
LYEADNKQKPAEFHRIELVGVRPGQAKQEPKA